jgi:NhaD family Na+/H+ antiporter
MELALILVFVIGYAAIAFEHPLDINKSASALVTGVLCWTIYVLAGHVEPKIFEGELMHHFAEIASILFFLLSAMTIVELIDAHRGFQLVTEKITTTNLVSLLWIIGFITFFLSAALDNLTTTIVMVSILRKLVKQREARLYFVSLVVIAANAGGAWSPIGDVTTTMLWIGGQITSASIIQKLFLPSLVCLVIPILLMTPFVRKIPVGSSAGDDDHLSDEANAHSHPYQVTAGRRNLIFVVGLLALLTVPVFKTVTHLPPMMGILLNLGILWIVTEVIHRGEERAVRDPFSVVNIIRRVDVPSVLFFLGILLAVSCLGVVGILGGLATYLDKTVGNLNLIAIILGLLSAIIDNVPLVAAAMEMYSLETYPADSNIWEMVAYCAGTGGSCLIIGSAAGVAAMGMEHIDFMWYARRISWIALLGYLAGAVVFILMFGSGH